MGKSGDLPYIFRTRAETACLYPEGRSLGVLFQLDFAVLDGGFEARKVLYEAGTVRDATVGDG